MDLENCYNEDNLIESEQDSDVEARLYAEIYFDDSKINPDPVTHDTAKNSSDPILENLSITINPESNQRVVSDTVKAISDQNIQETLQTKENVESHLEDEKNINNSNVQVKTNVFQRLSESHVFQRPSKSNVFQRLSNKKEIEEEEPKKVAPVSFDSSEIEESKYSAGGKKQKSFIHNFENYQFSSDSEESICEVPVPPKPLPIIINVGDSENDSNSSSDGMKTQGSKEVEEIILIDSSDSDSDETLEENIVINCIEADRMSYDVNELEDSMHDEHNESINSEKNMVLNENIDSTKIKAQTDNIDKIKKAPCQTKNSREMSFEEYFFQPMTERMKMFYNNSWGGEHFDHHKICRKMSRNPNMWKILDDDRRYKASRRYFGVKCSRCNRDGHKVFQCPEPQKLPCCYMCGKQGHYENRCPDKKCLTCGRKHVTFRKTCNSCRNLQCKRCQAQGHTSSACPDLWRQYHQTTNQDGELPTHFSSVMKPYYTLSCCNCAQSGHESTSCNKLRWSQHFPNPIYVSNYELSKIELNDSNQHVNPKSRLNGIHIQEENVNEIDGMEDFVIGNVNQDTIFCFESKKMTGLSRIKVEKLTKKDILRNLVPQRDISTCLITKHFQIFLESATRDVLARFELKKIDAVVCLDFSAELRLRELFQKILEQYFQRPNREKKYLYYRYDRSIQHVRLLFTLMQRELSQTTETPQDLYEKINSIVLGDAEEKNEELLGYHKKLLLSLFKSGCLDIFGSKKVFKKVKKFLKHENKKELCPILYFNLIYIFNRIFVLQFVKDLPTLVKNLDFKNITKYCNGKSSRIQPEVLGTTNPSMIDLCPANVYFLENQSGINQLNDPLVDLNFAHNGNIAANPQADPSNKINDRTNHKTNISQDAHNNSNLQNSLKQKRNRNKETKIQKLKIVKTMSSEDKLLNQLNDMTGREKRVKEILRAAKSLNCPEFKKKIGSLYYKLYKNKRISGQEIFQFLVNIKLKELELSKSNKER